ncbi:energy transducer TonB [Sphingomonas sp. CJ20]
MASLTLSLTVALLGAVVMIARGAPPSLSGGGAMRVFDVSGAEDAQDPPPQAEARGRAVESAAAPAASPRVPSPPVAQESAILSEPGPPMPMLVSPAGLGAGEPAGSAGATSAAPAPADLRAGPAASQSAERHADADTYGRTVFREIRARQTYPAELARAGLTGTVVVELRVSPRGRIVAVAVLVSSESTLLDRLALAQIQSVPLPPPPRGEARTFRIPMTYRLG